MKQVAMINAIQELRVRLRIIAMNERKNPNPHKYFIFSRLKRKMLKAIQEKRIRSPARVIVCPMNPVILSLGHEMLKRNW